MNAPRAVGVLLAILVVARIATASETGADGAASNPAQIVDRSRDPARTNDYLRVSFLADPNLVPSTVNRSNALRAFFTASRFFEPPSTLEDTASFVGQQDMPDQNLAAYRCRPPGPGVARLATWPNVMVLLQDDLGSKGFSCPAESGASVENVVFCVAASYVDSPEPSVTRTIEQTYAVAGMLFDPAHPDRADLLRTIYGIFPAFSGLGYAVRGSERGAPFTTQAALRDSIVPEYLLPNLSFADLGCACIIVPPYSGRSQDPIDPEFISAQGTPDCRKVDRLRRASDTHDADEDDASQASKHR